MLHTVVIVGGGIAGISCLEALIQDFDRNETSYNSIILISESKLIKKIVDYELSGRHLEKFHVVEQDVNKLYELNLPDGLIFKAIIGNVERINYYDKSLIVRVAPDDSSYSTITFDRLCLCHGARPKHLQLRNHVDIANIEPHLTVLRDTTTVENFRVKLANCRRLVIVGNGGISLELVSKVINCDKIWIIRNEFIGFPFFDSGAGKFLLDSIDKHHETSESQAGSSDNKSSFTSEAQRTSQTTHYGPSLGPSWLANKQLKGLGSSTKVGLEIFYQDEIEEIIFARESEYLLNVLTKRGKHILCDHIAVAIGVEPNKSSLIDGDLDSSEQDGGILIDEQMRTSSTDVYAAGDIVSCEKWPKSELWFRMRLWTQARQMGYYAGRCIAAHFRNRDPAVYFNFDCFTHCTAFFGFKFILLGQFNGQLLSPNDAMKCEVIARVTENKYYIKILLKDGKIIGAVLIGDHGLEETIENLIHDQIDITNYKEDLLDGTVDIEDYFD